MPWSEILAAAAAVAGGLFTYLGVRYTGRQARNASAITRAEDKAVTVSHDDVDRRRDVVESWQSFTETLRAQMADQNKSIAEQNVRIADLVVEVNGLHRKMDRAGRTLTAAIAYIERLLDFISAQLPDHPAVPVMPAEVRQQMHEH